LASGLNSHQIGQPASKPKKTQKGGCWGGEKKAVARGQETRSEGKRTGVRWGGDEKNDSRIKRSTSQEVGPQSSMPIPEDCEAIGFGIIWKNVKIETEVERGELTSQKERQDALWFQGEVRVQRAICWDKAMKKKDLKGRMNWCLDGILKVVRKGYQGTSTKTKKRFGCFWSMGINTKKGKHVKLDGVPRLNMRLQKKNHGSGGRKISKAFEGIGESCPLGKQKPSKDQPLGLRLGKL